VTVSSIIPAGANQIAPTDVPKGAITHCVLASMTGGESERVGAGIAWAFGRTPSGERYGLVAEYHGSELPSEIDSIVRADLLGMAEVRGMVLEKVQTRVESTICKGGFGAAVSLLVLIP
jgi:arginine decarboxylase